MPPRSLARKWKDYRWAVDTRRYYFDLRHPRLRWMPVVIAMTFVATTAIALVLNAAVLSPGVNSYLLGLVFVDCGMVAVEVMAWLIGRKLWREDRDYRYVGIVVGFASLPVWGLLEALCVSRLVPQIFRADVCAAIHGSSWFAVVWLVAVPSLVVLHDFRRYLARTARDEAV